MSMDYKEKYEAAPEKARGFYANRNSTDSGIAFQILLKDIFPELAENEDEKIRKELIDILEKSYEFGGFTLNNKTDLDRYIAYLEKQKEHRPAEWSEEDERMLTEIINSVNGFDAFTGIILQNSEQHERKINWLKSLRPQPHWKPSEEQMDALIKTITWLVEKGNPTDASTLAVLRHELQKLM